MQTALYELTCKWCHKTFTVRTQHESRKRKCCSQECARRGNWKENPRSAYRKTQLPEGHPLAEGKSRSIQVHQLVLWDKIGSGTHPCHYCATPVTWLAPRFSKDRLETEHLDRDRLNNGPENLVPCCRTCNQRNRAMNVGDGEPWRLHAGGWRIRGNPSTCQNCGKAFVARRDNKGMFCSRPCSDKGRAGMPRVTRRKS